MARVLPKQIDPDSVENRSNWSRFVPNTGDINKYDICVAIQNDGPFPKLVKADADTVAHATASLWLACTDGVVDADLASQPTGLCAKRSTIEDVDTSAATVGDPVYLSNTAGGWSLTAGTFKRRIGFVRAVSATAGVIEFDGNISAAGIISGTATVANAATTAVVTVSDAALSGSPAFAAIQGEAPLAEPPVADSAATSITRVFWTTSTGDLTIEVNGAVNHATGVLVSWAIVP